MDRFYLILWAHFAFLEITGRQMFYNTDGSMVQEDEGNFMESNYGDFAIHW